MIDDLLDELEALRITANEEEWSVDDLIDELKNRLFAYE